MRRNLGPLCLLALTFFGSAHAQQDPYSEGFMHDVLASDVTTSHTEKALSRLGDRAAVAVMRSLADRDMNDPAQVKKILWVLQSAFSVPQNINEPVDRTPKASLFLLHCLREAPANRGLLDDIESTRGAVLSISSGARRGSER